MSIRWLAPELLFPDKFGLDRAYRTKETDVYAFAMVMYEVGIPFSDWTWPHTFDYVTYAVHRCSLDHSRSKVFGTKL